MDEAFERFAKSNLAAKRQRAGKQGDCQQPYQRI
jgi:hypothetical protein